MRVKLKWVNRNNRPVTTRIYRTDTIVPVDQLGAPLVELDGTITEWIDLTAVRGRTYYYVFGTVAGEQVLYSIPLKVDAIYSTGPGPNVLVEGDQSLGYFGVVSALSFLTVSELQELCGLNISPTAGNLSNWDKWQRNGKILFVPRGLCHASMAWSTAYSSGLMFGTNDDGPWRPAGAAARNQLTIVTKGFNRYIVRCPTTVDDRNNPTRVIADSALPSIRRYSEVADLIYPMNSQWMPLSQRFPRRTTAYGYSSVVESKVCLGQEKYLTGFNAALPSSATSGGTMETLASNGTGGAQGWKPILELVQSDFVVGSIVL